MEFTVEFYENEAGQRPVQEFLDELKASDPDDFAAVLAGLAKLRHRSYHREPLSKALGEGLFEIRHVGKLNTRVFWFFAEGRRILTVHGIRNKGQGIPGDSATRPQIGSCAREGLAAKKQIVSKSNFDRYLEEQLRDPSFAARFERAGEAWDVALQLAALREQAGLSQKALARKLKTSQQQISRLESPGYEGHSLGTLPRVAKALNARIRVIVEPVEKGKASALAEDPVSYRTR
jgi:ribosome-binding protein aMBF1 (putative translation factor)